MKYLRNFVILCFILGIAAGQGRTPYRICTSQELVQECEEMLREVPGSNLKCVSTVDKINCIEKISKDEADFVPLEPEEMYVAHRFLKDGFKVIAEVRSEQFKDRDFRYEPVAVVRKSSGITSISDLKGRRSCHTGFGRNAGWKIPFSHLMDKGELPDLCSAIKAPTPEKDLYAISNYFKHACAPGLWVPEPDKDRELKKKYPNLCELCQNPGTCLPNDKFGGYEGALKCLTENNGDIAWTKMDAVIPFFKLNSQPIPMTSEYAFLCWDGSSLPLNLNNTCSWAKRPWKAYLASSRLSPTSITELQNIITQFRNKGDEVAKSTNKFPDWMRFILEITPDQKTNVTDVIFNLEPHLAKLTGPLLYLDKGKNYSVTIEKPSCATGSGIKFCVKSELEKGKCLSLQLAAAGRRILPKIECVLAESNLDCIQKVENGQADLVNLSPKDSDWAQTNYNLIPVLSEVETNVNVNDSGPYRYALAVLKSSDTQDYRNLSASLSGKRSCHGSIRSVAGWNAPLSKLRELGLISGPTCGLSIQMSQFFGNQSCVPGAKEFASPNMMPWLPTKSLCALCAGDGPMPGKPYSPETLCSNDGSERYFGFAGALRCLLDGAGQVAFIDHVGLHGFYSELNGSDFKLLCPNGSVMTNLTEYASCHWGKVPSNQILTRGGAEYQVKREDVRLTLLKISDTLGPGGKAVGVMNLFGPYFGNSDLLFQDTSVGLCDYKRVTEFDNLIQEFDYCTTSSGGRMGLSGVAFSIFVLIKAIIRL